MNIKILNWKLNHIGGIATWIINVREALKELGHKVETIHTSDALHMKTYDKEQVKVEDIALVGKFISLRDVTLLCKELNSADLIIIAHPSPHPTRDQLRQLNDGRLWQQVYKNITTRKVVMFHDNRWEEMNGWLAEVAEHIDHICCAQFLFTDSASRLPLPANKNRKITWLYFPIKIPQNPFLNQRENICVSGTQWLYWKRHKELLPILPELPMKIHFYNSGLWYYNLRCGNEFWSYVTDNFIGRKAKVEERAVFYGNVIHEEYYKALQDSLCSIDFSKRGYVNYTHWEPLLFGCVLLVHEEVVNNKWCKLPRTKLVRSFTDKTLAEEMERLLSEDNGNLVQARQESWEFCRDHLDRRAIANELLKFAFD